MTGTSNENRIFGGRFRPARLLKAEQGVETLRGTDLTSGADVLIKTTSASLVPPSVRRRLAREALVLREVKSPWLAPIVDAAPDGDDLYLVRPFVPGVTLEQRLSSGPLPVRDAITVARCILTALQGAHSRGVVHRDIRPSNVIVDEGAPVEQAVLVDFGLGLSGRSDTALRNLPVRTVRYMSPEQMGVLDRGVDARSDLYSVGVLLFECLAGHPPFDGDSVGDLLRLHLTARPPDLRSLVPAVPGALDRLVQQLLRKDPRDRYQSARAMVVDLIDLTAALDRGVAEPVLAAGSRDRRLTEPTFIGRRDELAALDAAIEETREGQGGLVLLEAESGGGKTWLLDELARRSAQKGAWVLHGQGLDQAAQQPFQMMEGVVRELVSMVRTEEEMRAAILARLGDLREAACATLPQLGEVLAPVASGSLGPEEYAEARSLPALAALLDALGSAERPAVVLLDDCQWADELTVKLLGHWARQQSRAGGHVLVLAAFRSEEAPEGHVLRELPASRRLALPRFQAEEVRSLLESMAGAIPGEAVDFVVQLSAGSPFMATAGLHGLVDAGALVAEPEGWRVEPQAMASAHLPRQATAFLTRRLELLPEPARSLLSVGAVLGKEFELDFATALANETPQEAMSTLNEARRRHILRADAQGVRCAFVHDKLREALLDQLHPEARHALHLLAAERIELMDLRRAFDLAYHFDAADEPARALPYALTAAGQARSQHALEIAERYYRIAERGAEGAGEGIRRRVAEGLGEVLMLRGRYDDAAQRLERARSLAKDRLCRAQVEGKVGELAFKRGDMGAASQAIERGLEILGRAVPRTAAAFFARLLLEVLVQVLHTLLPRLFLARRTLEGAEDEQLAIRLYSRLAYAYWFQRGKVPCLWAHLREMNLAERYPPTPELAQAYSEHAPAMTMIPYFRRGIAYAERSLAIRKALGDPWGQGQSLHFYGVALYGASRFSESIEKCREAVRLLELTGDRWELNVATLHIAFSLYRLGDLREALEASRRVHQTGVEIGDHQSCGISLDVWSKASGGRVPGALIQTELSHRSDDRSTTAEVLQAEGLRLLAEGRPGEAAMALEQAQALVEAAGLHQEYVAPILPWLATALRRQAEATPVWASEVRTACLRRAANAAGRGLRVARRYRNNLPHALRECALLAASHGRSRRARKLLDESLAVAARQGARYEHAQTLRAGGRVGLALGWPRAAEDITAARQALRSLGAEFELADDRAAALDVSLSLADRFSALFDAGRKTPLPVFKETIFAAVREATQALLPGERCLVFEVAGEGDGLSVRPAGGETEARYDQTAVRRAVETGRPVVIGEGPEGAGAGARLSVSRPVLCAPILVRGRAAGCFYLTHREAGETFGESDERLAEFIAILAGAALENAEGFAEITTLLTERKEANEAIRESERALSTLISNLPGVAYRCRNDRDWTIDYVSGRVFELTGYRPADFAEGGRVSFGQLIHPEDREPVWNQVQAAIQERRPYQLVYRIRTAAGEEKWVWEHGQGVFGPDGQFLALEGFRTDITERRALEEQLRHAQRMEAVGRLAGGIAHDFNNLLTVIMGRSELALAGLPSDDPRHGDIDLIRKAAARATTLTRQLLTFSRRQVRKPKVLDLGAVTAGMDEMLRRLIGEHIELVVVPGRRVGRVEADPGQLEQVLMNLAVNARDAMSQGGRLTIETADADLDEAYARRNPGTRPGRYVMLAVSDTGCGMDAETRAHVFEPFFTTKEEGKGSGLGLSTVYGIVKQSGGHIEVTSEPGRGARFSIYLPRVEGLVEVVEAITDVPDVPRGSETILLVEDEDAVRDLARDVLRAMGYTVLAVQHGGDALRASEQHRHPIHLLVTDVVMPQMSSGQLVQRLAQARPDMKVLYMSGYADDAIAHQGAPTREGAFLHKPFTPAALARKVRKLLDGEPGGDGRPVDALPESGPR